MSKFHSNTVLDAPLTEVGNATEEHVCTGDPADRAAVIAASLLSTAPQFGAIQDAAGGGREREVQQRSGIIATATGQADTICLINATELVTKTDISNPQTITSGNPVTIGAFKAVFPDPV